MSYDVIVVGGSYAGMSAALQIARARRNIMVIDAGVRRNRFAAHSHGFLGQDGVDPAQIAATAREQLVAYPNVVWTEGQADHAAKDDRGFTVMMRDGAEHRSSRLVLALGVTDTLPEIPGLQERWGRSVFHCPYCHGFELGGGPLGVLAVGDVSMHQAILIPEWGPTTLLTNGAFEPTSEQLMELDSRSVTVERTPVARITGGADVELADGRVLSLAGLFTASRTRPSSSLADDLGCALDEGPLGPFLRTDAMKATSIPGVFACGDAARGAGSVSLAVGDGALAGAAVHRSLILG
ncbi:MULTISPECIES: NAD(P)/FAD-dependent oxidoreductase [unclassified Chelatococcus]|uniref:NAD(P)/FAD-dependent oxidoreductase n=1 Tax=unclassified Chelatococcus TaxID=2638111 RepID=UPI001BD066BB|nr:MULTISPECIES: NAD(P)/FAD-dependent oxidoreductase [unclassified Chelatococcus]CAH1668917.1 Thioredoxin reductase [Hyphomicrobiales bacterium]MBS7739401.1 NAD(P)/FAD-dependent oxidoreductase [Chelatococcus sp. HY11]MBX3543770.1 NAD(P)/FAD-dependent oxidoreductase [Chelatococcus sp.]MCO5076064.1 NAD(P)/FAD-dependent oxidoreductase [Chelatococcus sp.]CAH1679620.1 Thioredoxin reductase [Hyphomicrobiales bacterium]